MFSVQNLHLFTHLFINSKIPIEYLPSTISGAEGIMLNKIDYILALNKYMVWWGNRAPKSETEISKTITVYNEECTLVVGKQETSPVRWNS